MSEIFRQIECFGLLGAKGRLMTDLQTNPKSRQRLIAAACSILFAFMGLATGGYFLLDYTADRVIALQAERSAVAWAKHISSELDQVEAIVGGAALGVEEAAFLQRVTHFGDVFRFKLFDNQGRLRLVSEEIRKTGNSVGTASDHTESAVSVLETGQSVTTLNDGTNNPDRPDLYVESYVPVVRDGRTVAVAEVYLDQTANSQALKGEFSRFGLVIGGLVLFIMYLGLIALWRAFDDPGRAGRVAAVLTLVGFVNIPIIKFSVNWWNTLHQPASVMRLDGPTIHASMLWPLLVMAFAFTLIFLALHLAAMRAEIFRRRVRTAQMRAAAQPAASVGTAVMAHG